MIGPNTETLGGAVSTAGDINADGIDDLVLSDTSLGVGLLQNGISYVIFGTRQGFPSFFNINNLNGTNGFNIPGIFMQGSLGQVNTLGDVNDDGIDDLILGAAGNINTTSTAYIIFGSHDGFAADYNLCNHDGTNGFNVSGSVNSCLGYSVSSAGDINGDGLNDILLGAPCTNLNTGAAYVIFGKFQLAWLNNQLTITEGQTVLITFNNLNATAVNNPTAILTFTVSNVQGGRFALVSTPNTSITGFTQQQISSNQIQFVSDRTAPVAFLYNVNVTDGQSILRTTPA